MDVNFVLDVKDSCRSEKIEVNLDERQDNVKQENARVADATPMIIERDLSAITHDDVSADSIAYVDEEKKMVERESHGVPPSMYYNPGDNCLSVPSALKYPWFDEHDVTSGTRRGVLLTDNMSDLSTCHTWS